MKTIKFSALLLAITAMVSCQKEATTYNSDPAAVKIAPTVGSTFTRSNPTDDAASAAFKVGDEVAVAAGTQSAVRYTLGSTAWVPEVGKYLRWETNEMIFNAHYPAVANQASMTAFGLPIDQSTLAMIEQADYMTYTSPTPQAKAASINLALNRKMARVVISPTIEEQYTGYTIEKVVVNSNTNGYADSVPKRGQINIDTYTQGGKFYALLSPTVLDDAAAFLTITVKLEGIGENSPTVTETIIAKGIPELEAGKSYAYTVAVGKTLVKITEVTVTDWTQGGIITGGEALTSTTDPSTHTVHLMQAGDLTENLIIKAIGLGKDLIITGEMGPADFKTLLRWGTLGLSDSNADLLRNLDLTGVTGLTAVPAGAFSYAATGIALTSLQSIALPTTVTSVGEFAFDGCTKLATFTVPELLTVGETAFRECTSLAEFTATKLQTVGVLAFSKCTLLAEFTAPELLTVGEGAFQGCNKLAAFTATKVQTVGNSAFSGCLALTTFTAPEVQTVGNSAFWDCKELTAFTATKLQTVGEMAFANCNKLAAFTAAKVQTVGELAFLNCSSLTTFTAPELLTVGKNAFQACLALTEFSAAKLTSVGEKAFQGCYKLATFAADKLQTVGKLAFSSCTALTEFTAAKLTSVEESAFQGCTSLATFSTAKLQTVGVEAFQSCTALTTFTAPELLTVGNSAFNNCTALTSIICPKLTAIGSQSFHGCDNLAELHLTSAGNITLDPDAFTGFYNSICILHLHQNKKNGGGGTPSVGADGKTWGGRPTTWKDIVFE